MHQPSPTTQLAHFIATTPEEDLPARCHERAKDLLIDHLGVAYAGLDLPWSRMICARALADGGPPESTIYGHGKVAARNAALANATVAHAIELDDTHIPSFSHMSAVVFPAALAMAEAQGASGKEFLAAYILGTEAMGRIGRAAGRTALEAGFHPTSTSGVFGAAAAAARILKLSAAQTDAAFGLALSMASGVMQFALESEGTMVKRLHAGLPAERGILAALLAADGFSGPRAAIEGARGFLQVFARHGNTDSMLEDLGTVFMIDDVSIKLNACCLHFASLVDAIRECKSRLPRPVTQIQRIEAHGPKALLAGHMEYRPRSVMAAQYSLPYVCAATLLLDPEAPASFDDTAMTRPDLLAIADRVTAFEDDRLERLFPGKFAARVRIIYTDGEIAESCVEDPRGSRARPLDRADLEGKFRALNQGVMSTTFQNELLAAIGNIDAPDGVRHLGKILGEKREAGI
jgi:2-methylcitrate dehydratase PrpD